MNQHLDSLGIRDRVLILHRDGIPLKPRDYRELYQIAALQVENEKLTYCRIPGSVEIGTIDINSITFEPKGNLKRFLNAGAKVKEVNTLEELVAYFPLVYKYYYKNHEETVESLKDFLTTEQSDLNGITQIQLIHRFRIIVSESLKEHLKRLNLAKITYDKNHRISRVIWNKRSDEQMKNLDHAGNRKRKTKDVPIDASSSKRALIGNPAENLEPTEMRSEERTREGESLESRNSSGVENSYPDVVCGSDPVGNKQKPSGKIEKRDALVTSVVTNRVGEEYRLPAKYIEESEFDADGDPRAAHTEVSATPAQPVFSADQPGHEADSGKAENFVGLNGAKLGDDQRKSVPATPQNVVTTSVKVIDLLKWVQHFTKQFSATQFLKLKQAIRFRMEETSEDEKISIEKLASTLLSTFESARQSSRPPTGFEMSVAAQDFMKQIWAIIDYYRFPEFEKLDREIKAFLLEKNVNNLYILVSEAKIYLGNLLDVFKPVGRN